MRREGKKRREREGEEKEGERAASTDVGLVPVTLGSRLGPRFRVTCPTNWATQLPLIYLIFIFLYTYIFTYT